MAHFYGNQMEATGFRPFYLCAIPIEKNKKGNEAIWQQLEMTKCTFF